MNTIPNLLIIENDTMTSDILSIILEREKFNLTIAKDGNEAISLVQKKPFDLILIAILIPPRSGLEVINYLSKNYPNIPIVALSNLADEEKTVEEAFQLGVSDFIAKPFNPNELLLRIKRLLKK
ncbi:two-component system, OmpR family, response regulator RegX3 [Flavobacterium succinicans]|uniref:Two-component system, OmpR family, response regulator RegX3 n=1 Tax=Flavobacterium succinicans TaxID=29536 RepID=A0A1I4UCT3_9FLAO|nr:MULTISPECIES: response regulator [Flavobacterium]SFM86778.1 two-component system, OmpR family, response regulator RegX3 [Flavobacterium succinicans]